MTLADLRRLSIRKQLRIHFRLGNGMECIVTEHGVAQAPGLKGIPDFNLEEELASAEAFLLEPAEAPAKKGERPKPRSVARAELAAMTGGAGSGAAADREEE